MNEFLTDCFFSSAKVHAFQNYLQKANKSLNYFQMTSVKPKNVLTISIGMFKTAWAQCIVQSAGAHHSKSAVSW